jgi:transposase
METRRHIGIDLHRNCFTACVRLENGRNYLSEWKLEDLPRFTRKLRADDEIAVEMTGNTRFFHEAVAPHVARVVAVDPNQFKVISQSVKKTDPNDARSLALYLAKDLLPEVRMKEKTEAQIASLTQTRDTLVKLRTALKNKINNILAAHGINLAKEALSSEKALAGVLEMRFDEMVELELEVIVEQIRGLNQSIGKLEQTIKDRGQKLKGHRNLTSIKGIGNLGASILLSVIGDIDDFADEGSWPRISGLSRGCRTPMKPKDPDESRNAEPNSGGRLWCSVRWWRNAIALTWPDITTRSKAGGVGARPSLPWPGNSLASFIAP